MVIQLKFYLLCMLSGPEKKVRRIVFLFSFFQQNSRWSTNHMVLWRAWTASPICSKEATYPGHMLIRFWCDSDIKFSRGLHKNSVTVLYFSIINVLCGAGGEVLLDFPLENLQKHGTISLLGLFIEYFFPTLYKLWFTGQAEATSTRPVRHMSELKYIIK